MSCEISYFNAFLHLESPILVTVGIGDIHCMRSDPPLNKFILKNVLFVPDLCANLFSVSSAESHVSEIIFKNGSCHIFKEGKEIVTGLKNGNLYRLSLNVLRAEANVSAKSSINLWHRRFGHINESRLEQMAKNKIVSGLFIDEDEKETCDACIMAKHHRVNFKEYFRTKATKFGKLHVDTCGPMPVESLGGAKYFVLFVDEYSNFRFIKFIHNKNEVLSVFKEVVAEIESTSVYIVITVVSTQTINLPSIFVTKASIKLILQNKMEKSNGKIEA